MDDERRLDEVRGWLTQLEGRGGTAESRDSVIAMMRSFGSDRLFPFLREILNEPDSEIRCRASLAIEYIDPEAGMELILPLLDDPDNVVRWHACGLLHDFGDQRAIDALLRVMKSDTDAQVRGTAAYALGGIGHAAAIPALIETLEIDHEYDQLGHSPSWCAATALDDILKTNHTRVRITDRLCTMPAKAPDLDLLKAQAMEFYRNQ